MSDAYIELAKLFKKRNNPKTINLLIGKIITPLPYIRVMLNEKVVLTKDNLIIAEHIYLHYKQDDINKWLNIDDEVIMMPTTDRNTFCLIDKVVRL